MLASTNPTRTAPPIVSRWFLLLTVLALGLFGLLAYANSFHAGLLLDNQFIILGDTRLRALSAENLHLQPWNNLQHIRENLHLVAENLRPVFHQSYWWPTYEFQLYRPVTTLSYLVNWSVLGNEGRPEGYHVVNFLLHWANAMFVFLIALRLLATSRESRSMSAGDRPALPRHDPLWTAALAATIFVVHPVETESVTNIVGRADELASLALLAGLWCHLRAGASVGLTRALWASGLGLVAFIGVFCKESAVMIAGVLLLHDLCFRWPRSEASWRDKMRSVRRGVILSSYIALIPAVVTLFAVRHQMFKDSPVYGEIFVDNPIAGAGWFSGMMTAFKVLGRYLGLLAFPRALSCDYSYNTIPLYGETSTPWEDAQCWLALALVGILFGIAWRCRRTSPVVTFGVLFFFVTMLPTANLLRPIGSIMGERFLYLPSIGFCLAAAAMLLGLCDMLAVRFTAAQLAGRQGFILAVGVLVLGALGLRTYARNADWRDELTLWQSAVVAAPGSFKTHKGLSNALWARGSTEANIDAAIASAERGLAVLEAHPLPIQRQDNTLFSDLGMYYRIKGEFLAARGESVAAQNLLQRSEEILLRAKEVDAFANQASRATRIASGLRPADIANYGNYKVYVLLAETRLDQHRWTESDESASYARQLAPAESITHFMLGYVRIGQGRIEDAAVNVVQCLLLEPANPPAWAKLRAVYATLGQNPVPIREDQNGRPVLDTNNPLARKHVNLACADLVRLMVESKQLTNARIFWERAVREFGCPPEALGPKPG